VKSLDEAVEWAKRCPNPMPGEEGVLEIRPTYAIEDLEAFAPKEEVAREARLRKQLKQRAKAKARSKPARRTAKRKPARAKSKK
jgi:hypothetical protein